MNTPVISIDSEFELMANYQICIESKAFIVENSKKDLHRFSLYHIEEPYPTYEEYMNGNDFNETTLIRSSNSLEEIKVIQDSIRCVKILTH